MGQATLDDDASELRNYLQTYNAEPRALASGHPGLGKLFGAATLNRGLLLTGIESLPWA